MITVSFVPSEDDQKAELLFKEPFHAGIFWRSISSVVFKIAATFIPFLHESYATHTREDTEIKVS